MSNTIDSAGLWGSVREPIVDLQAYFRRIGYTGSGEASLETLNALAAAHVQAIPFENVDVLLGRGIALDLLAIERKLIHNRRGGYCFEQNRYFAAVLKAMGFSVRLLSSRVRWQRPREFIPRRTHVFVRVEVGGDSWLADCGIGNLSLTGAIRLELDTEQATPHEPRRIVRDGDTYFHQVRFGADWHDVNDFTLEEMPAVDCEVANWFTSTHPDSKFRTHLFAARSAPHGGRLTLNDNEFSVRDAAGRAEKRLLASRAELFHVLAEHFGIHLDSGDDLTLPGAPWLA
jgi:N-hydroxyarylamine O-acetyltransferase